MIMINKYIIIIIPGMLQSGPEKREEHLHTPSSHVPWLLQIDIPGHVGYSSFIIINNYEQ